MWASATVFGPVVSRGNSPIMPPKADVQVLLSYSVFEQLRESFGALKHLVERNYLDVVQLVPEQLKGKMFLVVLPELFTRMTKKDDASGARHSHLGSMEQAALFRL